MVIEELESFYKSYPLVKGEIGKSYEGRKIYYFKVAKTERPLFIFQYSIHAREYITTYLAIEQIKDFIVRGRVGTVYFIPALNPDGINIAEKINPLYKANVRGVDLNVNFDARWGTGSQNVRVKASANYIGEHPFSEKESLALRDFTLKVKPDMTVSYHAKGEEIYYDFYQEGDRRKRDLEIAKSVSEVTGYNIVENLPSAGGYKDWCIEKLNIPSLTIEVGNDSLSHPIKKEHLPSIFNKNKEVVNTLTEKLWTKNL